MSVVLRSRENDLFELDIVENPCNMFLFLREERERALLYVFCVNPCATDRSETLRCLAVAQRKKNCNALIWEILFSLLFLVTFFWKKNLS